jgi:hypothetical protein
MNEKNTAYLKEAYPNVSRHITWFECHDGWFKLLCRLFGALESAVIKAKEPKLYYVEQVKQKFGALRVEMSATHDNDGLPLEGLDTALKQAESDSMSICETCGKPGYIINNHGWIYVSCDEHNNEKG